MLFCRQTQKLALPCPGSLGKKTKKQKKKHDFWIIAENKLSDQQKFSFIENIGPLKPKYNHQKLKS